MSRVLVTGAGGFIGRHALRPLSAAGYEVHAVTSRAPCDGPPTRCGAPEEQLWQMAPEVSWHRADLLAPGSAEALMRTLQPSHLLHLAWYTQPGAFWTSLENLDWMHASVCLLRAFGEHGGRRAVVAGTCTEYEWGRNTHCVEDVSKQPDVHDRGAAAIDATRADLATCMRPATLYGAAKHALHVIAERWAAQSDVALAWGRVFYVYGPDEHPARLVSGVARALLRGEEALCTSGTQVRDYMFAPDMGGAFAALLDSDVAGSVNMASGVPVAVADVVMAIATAARRPELVRLGALPQRLSDAERLTADVRRLREEVGWHPSVDLQEGAARTVDWWKAALARDRERSCKQAGASALDPSVIRAAAHRTAARPCSPRPAWPGPRR
jgi:nucleoside-diphosphate-sugar epimerase